MNPLAKASESSPIRPEILVVDDERGYREGIRRILQNRGYSSKLAANGAEALSLGAAHEFAVALIDLKMPDVDGFEVIDKLRTIQPSTLCIVVSAFATIESAVQTTKMGAFDFVVKPFVPDDLMVVVERALEKWRLAKEAERLRAEREYHLLELSAEKTRLRAIIQSMGDGLLVVNIDGNVVLDNPVARRLLGRVEEARIGGPIASVLSDPRFLSEIQRLLTQSTDELFVSIELALPRLDVEEGKPHQKEQLFLRATLAPVREASRDTPLGVVVLLADITDAKAFERMKTLFISMVAHELKAPIGAVEGYLNLIKTGTFDATPERIKEVSARCLERTSALLTLIQDLTEITRRDAGRIERRVEPINMRELAENLLEFHRNDAEQRKLSISLTASPDLPPVYADRGDMERVLTNLISNAIKYNRPGGTVIVRLATTGSAVALEVVDSGIGMSPEEARRLGEEFFRAKNPKTRSITGTGLGVALVKKVIESYNGALQVESVPDQGSTFRVILPVEQCAALAPGNGVSDDSLRTTAGPKA